MVNDSGNGIEVDDVDGCVTTSNHLRGSGGTGISFGGTGAVIGMNLTSGFSTDISTGGASNVETANNVSM